MSPDPVTQNPVAPDAAAPGPGALDLSTYSPFDSGKPSVASAGSNLRMSLSYGVQQNPDEYAKLVKQQQVTGMAPEVAKPFYSETQNAIDVEKMNPEQMAVTHPRTAAWAANPDNAAIAHDDMDSLTRIEQNAAAMRAATDNASRLAGLTPTQRQAVLAERTRVNLARYQSGGGVGGILNNLWAETKSLGGNIEAGAFGAVKPLIDAAGVAVQGTLESPKPVMDALTGMDPDLEGLKRVWTDPRTFWIQKQTGAVQDWLSSAVQHGPQESLIDPATQQPFKNPDYRWYGRGLANIAEQVPGQLAAFAMTGKAAGVSADLAGAEGTAAETQSVPAMLGTESAQNTYAEARSKGSDQKSALLAALASGVANYTLMGKMPGPVATSTVPGAIAQWAARSTAMGTGMTVADNTIARGYDPNRSITEGLPQSIATMAAFEGGGALGHIADAVEQSKLRTRSPEKFQENLEGQFEGSASLRIPAQEFVNYFVDKDIDPAAVANRMGVTNLHEAIAAGSDLEIPPANFFGKLDPEHQKGLLPDVIDPSTDMTQRQSEAGRAELQQLVAGGDAAKLLAEYSQADQETQATPEWQKVQGDLKQRYVDAGETDQAADNYATLHANAIANLAKGAGLKADELLALHNPQIVSADEREGLTLNQSVFHGSPYKFDKFTLDHIGSGEGAQAYGHGLYFASNKAIADYYRKTLAKPVEVDGKPPDIGNMTSAENQMFNMFHNRKIAKLDDEAAREQTAEWAKSQPQIAKDLKPKEIDKFVARLAGGKGGQLYEADIPEDSQMLHWDESFGSQPEKVKAALRNIAADADSGDHYATGMRNLIEDNMSGQHIYDFLANPDPEYDGAWSNAEDASQLLHEAGISGIKYLDANSRGGKDETHNYVVFDDNAIKVLKTYYQDTPEGGGGADVPKGWASADPAGSRVEKRGWFRILPDGRYEIGKTKLGDMSTFIHEPAHAYLELFRQLTAREGASDPLKDDFKKIAEWLGTTPEEAYKNGFTREQHEQWARANEQYVREGKAPTSGLERAFHNFSVWLGSIYRRAGALGVELSPDIRGVMDRLYAGDTAVDRAEQESGKQQLFESPEEAGWTEEQFRNYARGRGVEEAEARKLILSEMRDAAQRERTQDWRAEKSNVRDAVTEQIEARPEYRAIRALRSGRMEDGTALNLNRDLLVKQFGEERVKALQNLHRGLYRTEGGTDAETAAELLGFGSGEEMMRSLEKAPRRAQAIEAATRDTMTARHGDIRYDGSLDDKARLAVENSERAKNLHKELAALRAKVESLTKKAADAKAAMRSITIEPLERYQEAARQMIENKSISDLQPHRYLNASRKFSREAFDALRKGDVRGAADAKNKELLNHFLFREASAARDYAEKFESYAKRMQSRGIQQRLGLAGSDYREQFNWLMARYRLGPAPQAPERSLRDWADEVYGQGSEPAIAPGILNEGKFADYRNVPLSEVRDVHDALINIRHLAQQQFKMYVQGKQVAFADAKQAMIESARENLKSKPEQIFEENRSAAQKVFSGLQWVDSRLIRMERLVEWLDGGKTGPWHDNLWNLASDAQGDEYKLQEDVTQKVTDALADMPAEMRKRLWTEKVSVDGISEPLTRRRLLSMAFNMGNEGNLDRLRKTFDSFGWDRGAVEKIGGMLTREEWGFVQKAWDSLKPMGERMQELEKRLTGLPPAMVKTTPFRVALDDGTEMDLAGGYFPIVMDPRFSERAIQQDAKETAQNAMQSGYVRATTSKGYTKERTGFGGPLMLDYEQVLTSHVAKVAKDLSHREFMLASQRFLLDTEVRKTLRETLGPAYEQQMMPWLRTIINDNNGSTQERLDGLKDGMQKLRGNIVAASLGFNASTSLLQVSHAPRMLLYAKTSSLAQAFVDLLAHPIENSREVRELSPNEMRFRGDNLDRDIRAVLQNPSYQAGYTRKVAVAARFALEMMDHLLSHTLWKAAYRDSLDKYVDLPIDQAQEKAAHEADSAVRLGLGTSAPKDLPAIMRSNEFNKFITTLYGFHNGVYNQLRDIGHQARYGGNLGKATVAGILTAVLPAVLGNMLTGRGPKEDENPGWWAAKRSLLFSADTIPIVRSAATWLEGRLEGSHSVHDVQFSPIENTMEKGAKAAMEVLEPKDEKDWLGVGLDTGEFAGEVMGVPGSHQVVKTLRYMKRSNEGKVQNPNLWNAVVGGGR